MNFCEDRGPAPSQVVEIKNSDDVNLVKWRLHWLNASGTGCASAYGGDDWLLGAVKGCTQSGSFPVMNVELILLPSLSHF